MKILNDEGVPGSILEIINLTRNSSDTNPFTEVSVFVLIFISNKKII